MTDRVLVRGGCVLTLGAKTPNHHQADVLIEGGRIAEIGQGLRARDAEVVDATEAIVMPGFVDTHRHAWRSLFRNLGDGGDPGPAAEHYGPDDVYAATLVGLLSAVEAGITTVVDFADLDLEDAAADAALQAHADAGVRTVLVTTGPRDVRGRLTRLSAQSGGATSVAFGCSAPSPPDVGAVVDAFATARELGRPIHVHADAATARRGVIAALAERRLLGADVVLIHRAELDDAEADAIEASGAAVSLAPSSDMATGLGPPPIQALIDRDIRPGLGVDDERVAPGDLFAQMRATISLQHATVFDRKLMGKAGLPKLMSTRDVIRYATNVGARVAGLGDVTGSLEPGKQADLIVLRTDRPNIYPINDPIGAVVWGMDTSNVAWMFVGGRALMREGVLAADVTRARDLATAARERVAVAAGLIPAGSGRTA